MRPRVIPVILVDERYVVKTTTFRKPVYVGDPVNTVKLFNDKRADELVLLDIGRRSRGNAPDLSFVESVVSEAFVPVAYGGGINTSEQAAALIEVGVEKLVLNTGPANDPSLVGDVAERLGSQAVIANIDVKTSRFGGRKVYVPHARTRPQVSVSAWAAELVRRGAGELLLTSVDREGSRRGYDLDLLGEVAPVVDVPVIANGGAGDVGHFAEGVRAGASAVAAGTMFTFRGPRKAVLISYPDEHQLSQALGRG